MNIEELRKRYKGIPDVLISQKRWICYRIIGEYKIPISPFGNSDLNSVLSTDSSKWASFSDALEYCARNNLDGLGFEIHDSGIVAIDLNNQPTEDGKTLSEEEFRRIVDDFSKTLNAYTEWSNSGKGVHILCMGTLPEKLDRKNKNIQFYSSARFIIITGKTIQSGMFSDCTKEIAYLGKKYLGLQEDEESSQSFVFDLQKEDIPDYKVIAMASANKKSGEKFKRLFNGECVDYEDNKEAATQALCNYLMFYSKLDATQVDRIFRTSKLFDEAWDSEMESGEKFGEFIIRSAMETCLSLYASRNEKPIKAEVIPSKKKAFTPMKAEMNIDEKGEPIFRIPNTSRIKKSYDYDDTGNATRFYDYFGEYFHYDMNAQKFMFWSGKTWIYDNSGIVRKYANKLIAIMKDEYVQMRSDAKYAESDEKRDQMLKRAKAFLDNIRRVSNKSGKDAMIYEFARIGDIPVNGSKFNQDPYLINTESGVVDLRTGEIKPFSRDLMMSSNTKKRVSYETPKMFLKFLHDIFPYPNENDTEEVIECLQRSFGYSLTGLTKEQIMYLLHGDGSNGKSTLINVLKDVLGDYYKTIKADSLMASKNGSNNELTYSMAGLTDTRVLVTQETNKGERFKESSIKEITGADEIEARPIYGQPMNYTPKFKLWMMTNNLPYIAGEDYGIWRRFVMFVFKRKFKDSEKDKLLGDKLKSEYDRILGWFIQGAVKYLRDMDLKVPHVLEEELDKYKKSLDNIARFLESETHEMEGAIISKNELYRAYKIWAMNNNEKAKSEYKFREYMTSNGHEMVKNNTNFVLYYTNLQLNLDTPTQGIGKKPFGNSFEDDLI